MRIRPTASLGSNSIPCSYVCSCQNDSLSLMETESCRQNRLDAKCCCGRGYIFTIAGTAAQYSLRNSKFFIRYWIFCLSHPYGGGGGALYLPPSIFPFTLQQLFCIIPLMRKSLAHLPRHAELEHLAQRVKILQRLTKKIRKEKIESFV